MTMLIPDAFAFGNFANADVWLSLGVLLSIALAVCLAVWRDVKRSGYRLAVYLGFRALWLFCKLWHGFRPRGPDPLPPTGAAMVVANHTSPVDPLFLQCRTRRVISFMMAREYFGIKLLQPVISLCSPILVNRTGRDTAATKAALRALRDERVIGIFPEGRIPLDPKTLGEGKPGAAMMALMTRVPVIPAFIGRPVHTNRLTEGILVPGPAQVVYGRPIDLSPYYERRHDREVLEKVTELMMRSIEALRPKRDTDERCQPNRAARTVPDPLTDPAPAPSAAPPRTL